MYGDETVLDRASVRVAEYHRHVAPSEGLPDPRHYDMDSLLTVDMLLSKKSDFEGGRFGCLEKSEAGVEEVVDKGFDQRGTLVAFPSHKYHCVSGVTKGERRVLVVEFWRHA